MNTVSQCLPPLAQTLGGQLVNPMAMFRLRSVVGRNGDDSLKDRVSVAVRQIELHRRELEALRGRLETRRQSLFETTVRAVERRDDSRAAVYANEHSEVKKVIRVVTVSELALTQIIVRLESIRDVGDVVYHMTAAFRIIRKLSKAVAGLLPSLETTTQEVTATLNQTMVDLGNLSPTLSLDASLESSEQLVERAKQFAEERALELRQELPPSIANAPGDSFLERTQRVALVAAGEGPDNDPEFEPVLLSAPKSRNLEEALYKYIVEHQGEFSVIEAALALRQPVDEVERSVLKLVSEGRVKLSNTPREEQS